MRLKLLSLIVFAFTLGAAFSASATDKPALDELFKKLAKTGDAEAARVFEQEIWMQWLQSGSDSVDLLMNRGVEAMAEDDYETAEHLFTSIVEIDPNYAEGWNKRAMSYFAQDKYEEALVDLEQTLRLEPRHFGALAGVGRILEEYGQKKKALEAFRKAAEIHPHLEGVTEEIERLSPDVEGRGI